MTTGRRSRRSGNAIAFATAAGLLIGAYAAAGLLLAAASVALGMGSMVERYVRRS